jgi:hypothetical protein
VKRRAGHTHNVAERELRDLGDALLVPLRELVGQEWGEWRPARQDEGRKREAFAAACPFPT